MPSFPNEQSKFLEFLRNLATPSIIDLGLRFAADGYVSDCYRSGNQVKGIVRDDQGNSFSTQLNIISGHKLEAVCSCTSASDLQDQWCQHAVAVFKSSSELGFFQPRAGFAEEQSIQRMYTSSPLEIAAVIEEILTDKHKSSQTVLDYQPDVQVLLDLDSDRLGLRLLYDGEVQGPHLFEGGGKSSSRAFDNIILRVLDEVGSWDENSSLWYINSSAHIEIMLGLVQEYPKVAALSSGRPLSFSKELLEAVLKIKWGKSGAELSMNWLLPNLSTRPKSEEVLGTGPFWSCIDHVIYRLSASAARIASIFPLSTQIRVPRSQSGPILESLTNSEIESRFIEIDNPDLQPNTEIKTPQVLLEITRVDDQAEHFSSGEEIALRAKLKFQYPSPPSEKNLVYLPDKAHEQMAAETLRELGFEYNAENKVYLLTGDRALDFLKETYVSIPSEWKASGLDTALKSIRFSNLELNVSLASCPAEDKHKKGRIDYFDCHIALVQNNSNIPISAMFKSMRSASNRWLKLDNGAYARIPGGSATQLKALLGMLDPNFRLNNTIKTKLNAAQALGLMREGDVGYKITLDKRLEELSRKLREFKGIPQVKLSRHFCGELRDYQHEGVNWMHFLNQFQLDGILADEMGLGKTVQTLALLQTLKDQAEANKTERKPALVVAPTSVITNWIYEARRFAPKLKILLLHGSERKHSFPLIDEHDLVVTSYALLRLDRYELEQHEFSYLILDEAQNIKNYQAAVTKAAKSLKSQRRLALSGTPTENRPMELWSLLDFLMPGYLGSQEFFRNQIERPILEQGTQIEVARLLNSKTKPFILRRTKAEVEKELPPKIESELHVEMTPSQAALYAEILNEVRPKVFAAVEAKGLGAASISILAALLRLRQICNHPNSIDALKDLEGLDSGKFDLLQDLLSEALESGRKILLFSQFREMLAIIRRFIETLGVDYLYLDGTTTERQSLIDRFNKDEKVRIFLISLKAGGQGLNLTAADTVIIYDPWWNPAVEHQAVDRAHRIGQSKTVNVYRLVTENSIEQKIMELKSRKAKLVEALIGDNTLSPRSLSKADLENLFSFDFNSAPTEKVKAAPKVHKR